MVVHLFGTDVFDQPVNVTVVTDDAGMWTSGFIAPGDYTIVFETPDGYWPTIANAGGDESDSDPIDGTVSIKTYDVDDLMIDAGFVLPGRIGDLVWEDLDGDGIQDPGEPGVAGVTVTLAGADLYGNPVMVIVTTGPDGRYGFDNIAAGTYTLSFAVPDGFGETVVGIGEDRGLDSDGALVAFDFPGGTNLTFDLGVVRPFNVALTKTAASGQASVGSTIVWTITARNTSAGPGVGTVTIVDTLPVELGYVRYSAPDFAACELVGQQFTCRREGMPIGATFTIAVETRVLTAPANGSIVNTAGIVLTDSAGQPVSEITAVDNTAVENTAVDNRPPTLSFTGTDSGRLLLLGFGLVGLGLFAVLVDRRRRPTPST